MKRRIILFILWALVLGWIAVLFSLSAQPAEVSGKMSGVILENIYDNAGENIVNKEKFDKELYVRANQGSIRRTAHITMFFVLGVFTASASLYSFGRSARGFVIPPVVTLLYSAVDELVQLVTPGRSFEWSDLGRDALGAAIGIIFVYLIYVILRRIKAK